MPWLENFQNLVFLDEYYFIYFYHPTTIFQYPQFDSDGFFSLICLFIK